MSLNGQSSRAESLGDRDPRNRRAGAALSVSATLVTEPVRVQGNKLGLTPCPLVKPIADAAPSTATMSAKIDEIIASLKRGKIMEP